MKRNGIFHPQLARVLSEIGHTDELVICDAGLPIPPGVERVDLGFLPGCPPFLQVLDAVLGELSVESARVAKEMKAANPSLYDELSRRLSVPVETVPHEQFKEGLVKVRAVVRTGECTPYANVYLTSGVNGVFPGQDDEGRSSLPEAKMEP